MEKNWGAKSSAEKLWGKKKILPGFNYISCNVSQYSSY
jgi:hypothetical protein